MKIEPKGDFTLKNKLAFHYKLIAVICSVFIIIAVFFSFNSNLIQKWMSDSSQNASQDLGPADDELKRPLFPDIKFVDEDGEEQSLKQFRGKVILLSFWASWCAPCLEELPSFEQLKNSINNDDFEILAINVDEDRDNALEFIAKVWDKNDISFASYYDKDLSSARTLNIEAIPANYVIDKNGREAFNSNGYFDWSSEQSQELIRELLNEAPEKSAE